GNCLIYDARPFGCRTHYCAAAGGPYARREVIDLIRRLELIDAEVGGAGPRPLQDAITDALMELKTRPQGKRVIPRLAKRAEGPHTGSSASAIRPACSAVQT